MEKSAEAFRTISEVSELLQTPAHVLRFWESRFSQVKPVKRAGGRRYYRPADLALLGGIKRLLHDDGMTIRGVQKVLREQGVRHVAALSPVDLDAEGDADQPAPMAVIMVWISLFWSTLSSRAFSTLISLPRMGRMAWVRRSRPCLAEPPAESPSTM